MGIEGFKSSLNRGANKWTQTKYNNVIRKPVNVDNRAEQNLVCWQWQQCSVIRDRLQGELRPERPCADKRDSNANNVPPEVASASLLPPN